MKTITPKYLVVAALSVICLIPITKTSAQTGSARKLNVLLFTADDLDRNTLGVYGSPVKDISPNIDRFAGQSLRIDHAFVNSAICAPSRGIIMTGLYEHNSGVNGFYKMKDESKAQLITEVLRTYGYKVGVLGKVGHSTPKASFHWDYEADQGDLGNGRSPSKYYEHVKAFLTERKNDNKPFYFMVNSHDPHRPYYNPSIPLKDGEEKPSRIYAANEIAVPGFVSDLPGVREELSYYFNSTRRLDDTFGKVMQALEESGFAENTLVIFLSDNGIAIPFAKANAYNASNRTPFLVRWPGVVKGGSVNDKDFVSTVDYLPTILDALNIPLAGKGDGKSFLPLLKGNAQAGRDKVYTQIDYKQGGGPTPMRAVQDGHYLYIYNAWADGERIYSNNNEGLTQKAMEAAAATNPEIAARVRSYRYRAVEELYDLRKDLSNVTNLAIDPAYKAQLETYRKDIEKWMTDNRDPLLKVFQNRNNPELAQAEFYKNYPEAKVLDKDKTRYSKNKGAVAAD
ncbi:sulfatase family protein [Desertivirga arenae]|uniref:sulfatase family protein n=1 Tax=Desertivirga arenae TaxID=2810309 RepID=UPI001A9717B2|nr:sulfatase [Pedobacter sp. SYSU D00823]